jgi:L-fucose mutarotase
MTCNKTHLNIIPVGVCLVQASHGLGYWKILWHTLKVLDQMGHGDQLLIADHNYLSYASGKPVIEVPSTSILEVTSAILSVFPLDSFVEHPLERMEVNQDPQKTTSVQDGFSEQVRDNEHPEITFGVIP